MSYIAFFSNSFQWVGRQITIFKTSSIGTLPRFDPFNLASALIDQVIFPQDFGILPPAYQFDVATNSMYAPTLAAWPLSPLVVP